MHITHIPDGLDDWLKFWPLHRDIIPARLNHGRGVRWFAAAYSTNGCIVYIYNTYIMQNTPISRCCITGHPAICTKHKFFSKQTYTLLVFGGAPTPLFSAKDGACVFLCSTLAYVLMRLPPPPVTHCEDCLFLFTNFIIQVVIGFEDVCKC